MSEVKEKTETQPKKPDIEAMLNALPEGLQDSIRAFQANLISTIIAQQTILRSDEPVITITPDQEDFYKTRMKEVLESGVLNPHINPPIEIKEK